MTFFLIEIGKIARNTLKHNSDYINQFLLCLIPAISYMHTRHTFFLQSIQYTLTIIHIYRAEWLYAIICKTS